MASKRVMKIMQNLIKMAEDIDGAANTRIFSVLYSGNTIISYGCNQDKTHPFQQQWGKNKHAVYWHSETNAIFNALKRHSVEDLIAMKTKLFIARVKQNEDGEMVWGLAAPCEGCQRCIKHHGINSVMFTLNGEDGSMNIGEWKP